MSSDIPGNVRVLIADDDPRNRALLADICEVEGYEVEEVDSGSAALAQLRGRRFDLLVIDATMPGVSGFDVIESMTASPSTRATPVLMVTASPSPEARQRAESLGVVALIEKPFRLYDLTHRMRVALRLRPRTPSDPPTIPRVRARRALGDVLPALPPPSAVRPGLRRAMEQLGAANGQAACVVVSLENGSHIVDLDGRSARDAVLGALALEAARLCLGVVYRCDDDELCWAADGSAAGHIEAALDSCAAGAQRAVGPDVVAPLQLRAGVVILGPAAAVGADPDNVLRAARGLVRLARRQGARVATEMLADPPALARASMNAARRDQEEDNGDALSPRYVRST